MMKRKICKRKSRNYRFNEYLNLTFVQLKSLKNNLMACSKWLLDLLFNTSNIMLERFLNSIQFTIEFFLFVSVVFIFEKK